MHDAPGLRDWSGEALEREKLVSTWRELVKQVDGDVTHEDGEAGPSRQRHVGAGRLEELFRQAGAWQVERARQRGAGPWTISR